jgi:DNA-binding transcriptional LysR family regulator
MNIAQPALSIALVKLEKEIGAKLFDRKGRNIKLNEFGRIVLQYADGILNEVDSAKKELDSMSSSCKGVLTLGLTSFVATQNMIKNYAKQYDHIKLKQELIYPIDLMKKLSGGAVDVIISNLPVNEDCVKSTLLLSQDILLAVPKDHPLSEREHIDLIDAKDEKFICLAEGHADRIIFDQLCEEAGFKQNVAFEYFQSQMLDLVADGIGIAIAVDHKKCNERYKDYISFLRIVHPRRKHNVYLMWHKNRALSKAAKEFIQYAKLYYLQLQTYTRGNDLEL